MKLSELKNRTFTINGKTLDWLDEINACITFCDRSMIDITALLKEVMLNNEIAFSYTNIEKIKLALIKFAHKQDDIGFARTSEIFI